MNTGRTIAHFALLAAALTLSACGALRGSGNDRDNEDKVYVMEHDMENPVIVNKSDRETIWDLFSNADDPNTTVEVNKYLWNASLDVLSFMPVQSTDPFSGVIVFGYGTPPGGGAAYRATVHVSDPSLDARALHVALQTQGGRPVSTETQHAIEDAILHRARQLRVQDYNL